MSVGSWDPDAENNTLDRDKISLLLRVSTNLEAQELGLTELDVVRLAPLMRTGSAVDWKLVAESLSAEETIKLVRLLTIAEGQFPSWESGAKSPVVVLVKALRAKNAYPADLTGWIKANSENRFLPYGSLADRL